MQLPEELQGAMEELLQNSPSLKKASAQITSTYTEGHTSRSIFANDSQRHAYLAVRMPATYAACHRVLSLVKTPITHLLDLGAGPGTASWAAADLLPSLSQITLIEQSAEIIEIGKTLAKAHPFLQKCTWIHQSLTHHSFPQADAAILSYVLNELKDPSALIDHLWKTIPLLIVIEPGTPKNFALLKALRQRLIDSGAYIHAPCPHTRTCPNDWCHFSVRIERSRLHRMVKEGTLNYEDEKFCYFIAAKHPMPTPGNRILRHPLKQSGFVRLSLCAGSGQLEERTVTRKDKEHYREARDAEWGDSWM
jgi:ribosomal protein RSM22 (predicted rRNA methylase)